MEFLPLKFLVAFWAGLLVYYALPAGARRGLILAWSLALYAWLGGAAVALLVATAVAGWALALAIEGAIQERTRDRWLALGLIAGAGVLGTFKYARPVVPLGLSYYTLKVAGYLFDVYWGRAPAERSPGAFLAYVAYFPQIPSGPIQRAGAWLAEYRALARQGAATVRAGMLLIGFGCLKKVVGDGLAWPVSDALDAGSHAGGQVVLAAAYLYTLELYLDFSGYTDMARGASLLLGIRSPANFAAPFFAADLQEFWKRWHITLTAWLQDYLFRPLTLALRGWPRAGLVVSLTVNMLAVGVWHGATWTFVAFGLIHAAALSVFAFTPRVRARLAAVPGWSIVAWLGTLHTVVFAFVVFRARDLAEAGSVFARMCGSTAGSGNATPAGAPVALVGLVLALQSHLLETGRAAFPERPGAAYAVLVLLMLACWLLASSSTGTFIYQRF